MIVLIFVSGEDAKHAAADYLQYGVIGVASPVVELLGKALGKTNLLVPLPKDQQASIRGNILLHRLHRNGFIG